MTRRMANTLQIELECILATIEGLDRLPSHASRAGRRSTPVFVARGRLRGNWNLERVNGASCRLDLHTPPDDLRIGLCLGRPVSMGALAHHSGASDLVGRCHRWKVGTARPAAAC